MKVCLTVFDVGENEEEGNSRCIYLTGKYIVSQTAGNYTLECLFCRFPLNVLMKTPKVVLHVNESDLLTFSL